MSDHLSEVRRRLEEQLREEGIPYGVDEDGYIVVSYGNEMTYVRPLGQAGRSLVRISAVTNEGLVLTDELTRFLVTENAKLAFGGFEASASGRVVFSQTLLADFLQRTELKIAIGAVAATADRYNDEIKSKFGGKLFGED